MSMPTRQELKAARRVLLEDRAGFLALAPRMGILPRIAAKHFGRGRKLEACLWLWDRFADNRVNGRAEPFYAIEDMLPAELRT